MRKSMDPHRNIFFYYAGSSKIVGGRERQIEDNSTKALINVLELSARADTNQWLIREFLSFLDARPTDLRWSKFALQRETIGQRTIQNAKRRILLGIAPISGAQLDTRSVKKGKGSRPDAWIWTPESVVCIETKVVGKLDPDQLARHRLTLGGGSRFEERTWKQVYAFFADSLAASRRRKELGSTTALLEQFIEYLRIIAYRQEIDMGEFDGFRSEHFAAFTFLDDDEAEDTRRSVKHYLGQFVEAVRESLPDSLDDFQHKHVGNLRAGRPSAWATLSRTGAIVHQPHFSFGIRGDELSMKLLLEGARPTRLAKKCIEADPDRFLEILMRLKNWEILVKRRWQLQVRKYDADVACSIRLDRVGRVDIDYLIEKIRALEKPRKGQGYFELIFTQTFPVDDPRIRSKKFAVIAAQTLEELLPLERFLSNKF